MLHNADGGGGVTFSGKSVTQRYNVISITRGGWGSNFLGKSVT